MTAFSTTRATPAREEIGAGLRSTAPVSVKRSVLPLVAAFLVSLVVAAPASAARALAVGDSVMLGAKLDLERRGIAVDAAVSRQLATGASILRSLRSAGTLPSKVVIHLGTNGTITASQFRALMRAVGDRTRVVVLTLRVPRSWERGNNAVIKSVVGHYRNAVLVDWHWWGQRNPGWFWGDGYHLRPEGAAAYARLVAKALKG